MLGIGIGMSSTGTPSLPSIVASILRKFGSDAHVYMPGPGVPILGPELVTNGDFSNGTTGWTTRSSSASVAAGVVQITATASNYPGIEQVISGLVPGRSYLLSGATRRGSCVADSALAVSGIGASEMTNSSTVFKPSSVQFVATSTTHSIGPYIKSSSATAGETFFSSGVSVKEILGYTSYLNGFQAGNYLESTGNTVGAVDNPVGLVLDGAGKVGAEISTNNDFTGWSGGTGWTFSGGKALANAATGNASRLATLTAGKTYKVVLRCDSYTSGGYKVLYEGGQSLIGDKTSAGTFEATLQANATGQIYIWANSALTATFDYVSVREVTGIHATQPTTANKPILRRGIVNLLSYSNDLTNAAWTKTNINNLGSVPAPDGSNTASNLNFVFVNPITRLYQDTAFQSANGTRYTFAVWMRSATPCKISVGVQRSGPADPEQAEVDVTAMWQLFVFSHSGVFTGTSAVRGVIFSYDTSFNKNIEIWRPGLFQGTLTAQQIIAAGGIPLTTTAPASSSRGPFAWQFDGVNDVLALPGPLFQMTDDHCVIAAAAKNSVDTNSPGVFAVEGGATELIGLTFSSAKVQYFLNAGGTATYRVSTADYQSTPAVISGRKIGSAAALRVNGVQQGATLSTSAVGSNAMTSASIGRHAYTSVAVPLNGLIYPVIAIKGTVSDADLKTLEKWVGSIARVAIS